MPPWRNRLARSAVNRKVGGSSPPGGELYFYFCNRIYIKLYTPFNYLKHNVFYKGYTAKIVNAKKFNHKVMKYQKNVHSEEY